MPSNVKTDQLEAFGLGLLIASAIAFTTAAVIRESARPEDPAAASEAVSRTIRISMQARAAGRTSQADALLVALAALPDVHRDVVAPSQGDALVEAVRSPVAVYGVAGVIGVAGFAAVACASRRRRATLSLLADRLEVPVGCRDAARLVDAATRLLAGHAAAEFHLQKLRERTDAARRRSRPAEPASEFGRIVEITAVDP